MSLIDPNKAEPSLQKDRFLKVKHLAESQIFKRAVAG